MFWKRKSKSRMGPPFVPFAEKIDTDILVNGIMSTDKCSRNLLLTYILNAIPESCTISIVDLTHSEPKSLCTNAKGYDSKKMYEVISLDKYVINDKINYYIRVIEII